MSIKKNGSITVFLALTLTIVISLLFGLIESARITSCKVRCTSCTYLAMDSAFCHFARQLYDEYGIFAVFSSEEDFTSLIKNYCEKNINPHTFVSLNSLNLTDCNLTDIELTDVYHLTDNDGLIFLNQIKNFEKYRAVSLSSIEKLISDANSISDEEIVSQKNISTYLSEGTKLENVSNSDARKINDGINQKMKQLSSSNMMMFFVKDPANVSTAGIDETVQNKLPSLNCILSPTAAAIKDGNTKNTLTDLYDNSMLLSYINHSFSSYKTPDINTDLPLRYQKEYILSGCSNDNDTLLKTAFSITSLRALSNAAYIFSDSDKRTLCFDFGKTVCGEFPIASTIVGLTVLSSWAYAEGLLDVRDLLHGKKVPLMKSDNTWTLSLEGIINLGKDTVSKNPGDTGLCYDEYLNMSIALSDPFTNIYRAMDLIQIDICHNYNKSFDMRSCITAANSRSVYEADALFTNSIKLISPNTYKFNFDTFYSYD